MTRNPDDLPSDEAFETLLEVEDLLPMVLRTHQAIEATMNAALNEVLAEPHELEIRRIATALKIDFCAALRIVDPADAPAIRKVNALRNSLAHDPQARFTDQDKLDLFNILSPFQRYLVGLDEPASIPGLELLRQVLRMLHVQLGHAVVCLRDAKLRDVVMHEMVVDRIGERRPPAGDPGMLKIQAEIERRISEKREG
jgi:hypothetical protein